CARWGDGYYGAWFAYW
nr:immunoglobulin heavy chain junction region [Mus musculus]